MKRNSFSNIQKFFKFSFSFHILQIRWHFSTRETCRTFKEIAKFFMSAETKLWKEQFRHSVEKAAVDRILWIFFFFLRKGIGNWINFFCYSLFEFVFESYTIGFEAHCWLFKNEGLEFKKGFFRLSNSLKMKNLLRVSEFSL